MSETRTKRSTAGRPPKLDTEKGQQRSVSAFFAPVQLPLVRQAPLALQLHAVIQLHEQPGAAQEESLLQPLPQHPQALPQQHPPLPQQQERRFSSLSFIKNDQHNRLQEDHFNVCLRLFSAKSMYTLNTFPYERAFEAWNSECQRRGGDLAMAS